MLADLLESVVKNSKARCFVAGWLAHQDDKVNAIFQDAVKQGLPNYQQFYDIIKADAESRNEPVPFAITTMKNHLQSRCSCSKIGK